MREGLNNIVVVNVRDVMQRGNNTYKVGRSVPSWRRAERLLMTNEEDRTRPPRTLANIPRLSRTRLIAKFHSPLGRVVGSISGFGSRCILINSLSNGAFGIRRIRAPRGIETTPRASDIPHSRPLMRVTWKAAPPTKTIKTWTVISAEQRY